MADARLEGVRVWQFLRMPKEVPHQVRGGTQRTEMH